jgi:hypothetical protein
MDAWSYRFMRHLALLVIALPVLLLAGCGEKRQVEGVETFLERHWADPLPPQGAPPPTFTPLEASLSPSACGQCHNEQYEAWRTSLHNRAVGPGLLWQLKLMDQAQGNRCLRCHAPLAEQKALFALEHGWPNAPKQAPPAYVEAGLGHQGLVCAACHVRGHQRFGPPPRGTVNRSAAAKDGPHGGFTAAAAFADSRFCAHCHQFPDDGPRIAGKLQEDTYRQWQASPQARDKHCQSCHMPDRKHLWRGIHDPEMTRRAVAVTLGLAALGDGRYQALARVRNIGAGHHFPTYMVPKVELILYLIDAGGARRELGQQVIGWTVDTGITREISDTRIPAGASMDFRQAFAAPRGTEWRVELVVRVKPGEHYERIYRDSLARADRLPHAVLPQLRLALDEVVAAEYELLRVEAKPQAKPGAKPETKADAKP